MDLSTEVKEYRMKYATLNIKTISAERRCIAAIWRLFCGKMRKYKYLMLQ